MRMRIFEKNRRKYLKKNEKKGENATKTDQCEELQRLINDSLTLSFTEIKGTRREGERK